MHKKYRHLVTLFLTFLVACFSFSAAAEDGVEWPQEIVVDSGVIVIYQPQPESLNGVYLTARAAVGIEMQGSEPIFSSVWFGTTLDTDHQNRTTILRDIVITDVKFPIDNHDKNKEKKFRKVVETELTKRELSINLDNLIATLDFVEEQKQLSESVNVTPPKILFVNEAAVLITIDGAPQIRESDGVTRVINTPYTIVQDPKNNYWYLNADAKRWYKAKSLAGEWSIAATTPAYIQSLAPKVDDANSAEPDLVSAGDTAAKVVPKIIMVTEPTELISSTGKPKFTPIPDTHLLYVSNTDSDVILDVNSQVYYVLLSGRWYQSNSTEGPWAYTHSDKLPDEFLNIPTSSELSNVRYAVAGTEEAKDAVLEAQLPQTATVDRKAAKLEVEYDGKPQFVRIENTSLTYAVNTATPVIYYQNKYYAIDEAVWFVANSSQGDWQVATEIPDAIYEIPAESPLYNVTFVKIYKATPETVYVGYTQGYTNVYVYNGTVVYGTGYRYHGWHGHYYYPRPSTWGFHARYSPHMGWSYGLSYSHSPFVFYVGGGSWYRGGWWGPSHYRGYKHGYRHGIRVGYRAGYNAGKHKGHPPSIYRSPKNASRTKAHNRKNVHKNTSKVAKQRKNNVYADRKGNVHRNNKGQWEQRTNKGWSKNTNANKVNKSTKASKTHKNVTNKSNKSIKASSSKIQNKSVVQNSQKTVRSTKTSSKQMQRNASNSRQSSLNKSFQSRQRGNVQSRKSSVSRSGGKSRK